MKRLCTIQKKIKSQKIQELKIPPKCQRLVFAVYMDYHAAQWWKCNKFIVSRRACLCISLCFGIHFICACCQCQRANGFRLLPSSVVLLLILFSMFLFLLFFHFCFVILLLLFSFFFFFQISKLKRCKGTRWFNFHTNCYTHSHGFMNKEKNREKQIKWEIHLVCMKNIIIK